MIHSGFARDALNFDIVNRWQLIIQIRPTRAHPIIFWWLRWLINNFINSGPTSLVDSSGFTEGLNNLSTITSDGVDALEEVIQAR
jgi:hypothetical protein